jgi:predicted DNA-binding transcriptional regulator AlpA
MSAQGESLVLVPFGDRVLGLTVQEFEAARERGLALVGSTAAAAPPLGAEPERLLTAEQLSEVTGIPGPWFLERARQGQIPHARLGKYIRFRLSEIARHGAVSVASSTVRPIRGGELTFFGR